MNLLRPLYVYHILLFLALLWTAGALEGGCVTSSRRAAVLKRSVPCSVLTMTMKPTPPVLNIFPGIPGGGNQKAALSKQIIYTPVVAVEVPSSNQDGKAWRGAVLFLTILWSTNFAVIKGLYQDIPDLEPSLYAAIRFGLAALVLSPTYLGAFKNKEMMKDTLVVSFFIFLGYVGQTLGLKLGSSADKSAFISSLCVVWVAICPLIQRSYRRFLETRGKPLAAIEYKEVETVWSTVLLAVSGVAILELEGSSPPTVGDLFSFLQPVGFGTSYVLIANMMRRYKGEDAPRQLTGLRVFAVACFSFIWALSTGALQSESLEVIKNSSSAQGTLMYLSVVTTALGLWLQSLAFRHVSASDASLILSSEPVWAAIFASFLLGEGITPTDCLGGSLIVGACVANELKIDLTKFLPQRDGRQQ